MKDLKTSVIDRVVTLGVAEAAKFFKTPPGTVQKWLDGKATPTLAAAQLVMVEDDNKILQTFVDTNPLLTNTIQAHITMWEGKKVMILLPCYRTMSPLTHFTLFANYIKYGSEKLGMAHKDRTVIHEARNELIHIAMQIPTIETVIMIDDDMILPCGNENIFNGNFEMGVAPESAGFNFISRLMSHGPDKEVVGALYYGRHKWGMPQCDWGFNAQARGLSDDLRSGRTRGLIDMPWVGTGGIKIELTAVRKLKDAIDAGKYPGLEQRAGFWYGYFTPMAAAVGEDVSFCKRMTDIGVKVYCDASLVLGHADGGTIYGPRNTANKVS